MVKIALGFPECLALRSLTRIRIILVDRYDKIVVVYGRASVLIFPIN